MRVFQQPGKFSLVTSDNLCSNEPPSKTKEFSVTEPSQSLKRKGNPEKARKEFSGNLPLHPHENEFIGRWGKQVSFF